MECTDEDVANVLTIARKAGVTIHVRGTDNHPVVELRDKSTRQIVGGIELRKRIDRVRL